MSLRTWMIERLGGSTAEPLRGQEVHINLPPQDRRAVLRHLCRIQRCRIVLNQRKGDAKGLEAEIKRRVSLCSAAGLTIPSGDLSGMIEEYS